MEVVSEKVEGNQREINGCLGFEKEKEKKGGDYWPEAVRRRLLFEP